jgi:hypothetical protein
MDACGGVCGAGARGAAAAPPGTRRDGAAPEVLEVKPSTSRPDRGIARLRYQAGNQRGEAVLRADVMQLLRRRAGS